jgi:hypothetical protein
MNALCRIIVLQICLVLFAEAFSRADEPRGERASHIASNESLPPWLRGHDIEAMLDAKGDITAVAPRCVDPFGKVPIDIGLPLRLSREVIAGLAALPKLERLDLRGTIIRDEDFAGVKGFSALKELRLAYTGISGNALQAFSESKLLATLDLEETTNMGRGLEAIPSPSLQTLSLCGRDIGDDTIQTVARFYNLQHLDVCSARMTAKGVLSLAKLRKLRLISVTFYQSNVDDYALETLRRQLPKGCEYISGVRWEREGTHGVDEKGKGSDIEKLDKAKRIDAERGTE